MKKLAFSLVAFGATIVMSCGGGNSAQREQEVRDSLLQDSIKKVEAFNDSVRRDSIRRDSIVKDSIRQDSLWRYRTTPDLAIFELHGPVKSVTYSEGCLPSEMTALKYITFNKEGQLTSAAPLKIIRNKSGKISSLKLIEHHDPSWEVESFTFSYDSQNRLAKLVNQGYEWGSTTTFKYGGNGNVKSVYLSANNEVGGWYTSISYKYLKEDRFGNWIKRSCTYTTITEACDEYPEETRTTSTYSETRTITYYERKNK